MLADTPCERDIGEGRGGVSTLEARSQLSILSGTVGQWERQRRVLVLQSSLCFMRSIVRTIERGDETKAPANAQIGSLPQKTLHACLPGLENSRASHGSSMLTNYYNLVVETAHSVRKDQYR